MTLCSFAMSFDLSIPNNSLLTLKAKSTFKSCKKDRLEVS